MSAASTSTSVPLPGPNWAARGLVIGWALLLFVVCFSLGSRHHRFPYFYHPDEPGKVEQILTGKYNFHHPMLLLAATRLAVDVLHVEKKPQAVVEVGRRVSAAFVAGAVATLSLVAYLWRGWRSAMLVGLALLFHHQLYELAHYLKEDSALLFGVAVTLLCAMLYTQVPSLGRALALGAACALAISGKYLGVVMLALALPALWMSARRDAPSRLPLHSGSFAFGLIAMFVLVNLPLLAGFTSFENSLGRELTLVVKGQGDVTRSIPHTLYWNVFIDNSTPALWLGLIAFYVACWTRRARLPTFLRLLVLFPIAYAVALSFSPKENDRYFLPATALFTLFGAMGIEAAPLLFASIGRWLDYRSARKLLEPAMRQWIYFPLAALLILLQITGWAATKPGWSQYDTAFIRDDIASLLSWMKAELPADAVVVADSRTGLPNPKRKKNANRQHGLPQKLIVSKLASDEGTLDELRAKGVTHVVVSETSYGRFFRRDLRAKDSKGGSFGKARAFYEELLRRGELLFERERGTVIYLHPGIRVYRLPHWDAE